MKKFLFCRPLLTTLALCTGYGAFAVARRGTIDPALADGGRRARARYVPLVLPCSTSRSDDTTCGSSHSAEDCRRGKRLRMIADTMRASTTAEIARARKPWKLMPPPIRSMRFDCYFTEGVSRFVFDGNTVDRSG
ncbi:MAG: hypothetical protein ACLVB5_06460 [Christensenellales bacterium]